MEGIMELQRRNWWAGAEMATFKEIMDQLLEPTAGAKMEAMMDFKWRDWTKMVAFTEFSIVFFIGWIMGLVLVGVIRILDRETDVWWAMDVSIRLTFVLIPSAVLPRATITGLHPVEAANLAGVWRTVTIASMVRSAFKLYNNTGPPKLKIFCLVVRGAFVFVVSRFIRELEDAVIANMEN